MRRSDSDEPAIVDPWCGAPTGRVFAFEIDDIPASSKNRREFGEAGGRMRSFASKDARRVERLIRGVVQARTGAGFGGRTLFGAHYVGADITVDEEAGRTRIEVIDLGPQPRRRRGGAWTVRDVHGVVETVMDALETVAFDNDRQARFVRARYGRVP